MRGGYDLFFFIFCIHFAQLMFSSTPSRYCTQKHVIDDKCCNVIDYVIVLLYFADRSHKNTRLPAAEFYHLSTNTDTSVNETNATSMDALFNVKGSFNEVISAWNVSSATTMTKCSMRSVNSSTHR